MSCFDNITRIHCILIYTKDKNKIVSRYYTDYIPETQRESFESSIFDYSTNLQDSSIFEKDGYIVVTSSFYDLISFFISDKKCNELILFETQDILYSLLDNAFNGKVDSENLRKNIGEVFLILDDLIDQGYPFAIEATF
ncbi:CopZ Coatomer protein complex, subunit zeta 1 [Tritrichomonas foetus]|uniref:Coatomer subunit zeta n=1 Tax=Tritrichomonas foetus TaxID=1144522 RepID=A0A1J4K438_9EUKA|nr:CopZ Coatomer protein complex, subunit zeta 1 [Tritrichomonas foetus]|eukprot:OHT05730.1 CopZ Coatomer protein complex, subunit zeta 1 [Tritrichomonas foetus]